MIALFINAHLSHPIIYPDPYQFIVIAFLMPLSPGIAPEGDYGDLKNTWNSSKNQ